MLTCAPNEPVDLAARRLDRYGVSAMPVIDTQRRVLGIITSDNISKLLQGGTEHENKDLHPYRKDT
ncbi:CBS domain-containing protein [Methanosarcina horonobensis]|uniref:CBS domain-containing protein n=1 Tax=Methanosarcina horonobensis TaxID=418008 RepID=UPI0022B8C302|nr:CBS domain-containing protein [Methanosarcina horonobensis]